MKIVEFGEDGKPRLLKQAEAPVAQEVIAEEAGSAGKIKIREFDHSGAEEAPRRPSVAGRGAFAGAARMPQTIKIIDFDKEKAGTPSRSTSAQERPRGMKIVETD